jgi:hypothetical protein
MAERKPTDELIVHRELQLSERAASVHIGGGGASPARLVEVPYVPVRLAREHNAISFRSPRACASPRSSRAWAEIPPATTALELDAFALPAEAVHDAHPSSRLSRLRVRVRPEALIVRPKPAVAKPGSEEEEEEKRALDEEPLAPAQCGAMPQQRLYRTRAPSQARLLAAEEASAARAAATSLSLDKYTIPMTGVSARTLFRLRLGRKAAAAGPEEEEARELVAARAARGRGAPNDGGLDICSLLSLGELHFNGWTRAVMGKRLRACIPHLATTCDEVGLTRLIESSRFVSYRCAYVRGRFHPIRWAIRGSRPRRACKQRSSPARPVPSYRQHARAPALAHLARAQPAVPPLLPASLSQPLPEHLARGAPVQLPDRPPRRRRRDGSHRWVGGAERAADREGGGAEPRGRTPF